MASGCIRDPPREVKLPTQLITGFRPNSLSKTEVISMARRLCTHPAVRCGPPCGAAPAQLLRVSITAGRVIYAVDLDTRRPRGGRPRQAAPAQARISGSAAGGGGGGAAPAVASIIDRGNTKFSIATAACRVWHATDRRSAVDAIPYGINCTSTKIY
eukprot:SAG31_NODE_629_length_13436_cov_116.287825_15_plen_157_part_00